MAAAIENPARIDDQAWRMDFAGDHPLGLNLHAALRENHAVVTPRDDHTIAFDLPFNLGVLTKDQCLLRNNITLDVTVDTERSGELQGPFEGYALIDKSCPLFAAAAA